MKDSAIKNVICYVQRKLITRWKRRVLQGESPLFVYGSDDNRVFSKLKMGDSLWVISSIPNRPPELVAHILIEIVAPFEDPKLKLSEEILTPFKKFKFIAKGAKESKFFGHNDISSALLNTVLSSPKGRLWELSEDKNKWQSRLGKKLQRPTLIYQEGKMFKQRCSPGATLFEKIESKLDSSVFISYKWNDNLKRLARSLAYRLSEKGYMAWLDQLALPVSKISNQKAADEIMLEKLLKYGFTQSKVLIAIDSKNYGKGSVSSKQNWTLKEWIGELDPDKTHKRLIFKQQQKIVSSVIRNTTTKASPIDENTILDYMASIT